MARAPRAEDTTIAGFGEHTEPGFNDVRAARSAAMRVVCVSYGYNHGRDISEAAPDAVIDSLEALAPHCFDAA